MWQRYRKIAAIATLSVVMLLVGGCDQNPNQKPPTAASEQQAANAANGKTANPQETMRLTVYHATKDAAHVAPEVHVVPKNDQPAQTALNLLLAGTKNANLVSVIPQDTKVRSLVIKEHVAYVDFNDKLLKNNRGGSASEMLLVASIVNTLTEFPEVKKVQIMVEGKKVETLWGHMDTSEPLERSEKMIKKTL